MATRLPLVIIDGQVSQLPSGDTLAGSGTFAPTLISNGTIFVCPSNQQVLIAEECVIDGELVVDGAMVAVL